MTWTTTIGLAASTLVASQTSGAEPFRKHPGNPHYFLFRGKPTILITSAEHYGSVLNLDFDYTKYLDTLAREGMNHTRTFVGAYCEQAGDFGIARNTLAPLEGRFITPWARSDQPGYPDGGNKFDLTRFDGAYFARMKDFVTKASERGIVIEINLFCPFYGDQMWALSPMNAQCNVNGVGGLPREQVYSLESELLPYQEAMARKIVAALQGFDNVYFEVMNEPYCGNVPMDWQERIADVIVEAERDLPNKHLISLNIANFREQVEKLHPAVSLINFHYAFPPDTVATNWGLDVCIGDNETGFAGTSDARYRMEGWAFILAGGALYNNLDYSFVAGHEDGTFEYPGNQPGGGTTTLRAQLKVLADFMADLDFIHMQPSPEVLSAALPEHVKAEVLAEAGRQYAVYLYHAEGAEAVTVELALDVPVGKYTVEWVSPVTGKALRVLEIERRGQVTPLRLVSPEFTEDVALRVIAGWPTGPVPDDVTPVGHP